jgi:hypothetical protein
MRICVHFRQASRTIKYEDAYLYTVTAPNAILPIIIRGTEQLILVSNSEVRVRFPALPDFF